MTESLAPGTADEARLRQIAMRQTTSLVSLLAGMMDAGEQVPVPTYRAWFERDPRRIDALVYVATLALNATDNRRKTANTILDVVDRVEAAEGEK